MSKLNQEALMTIQTLASRQVSHCEIARLLGITEGAVRYRIKRMEAGALDGRARQQRLASAVAEATEHWREEHADLDRSTAGVCRARRGHPSSTWRDE